MELSGTAKVCTLEVNDPCYILIITDTYFLSHSILNVQ